MSVPQVRLRVENFRAVAEANIIIDGITIVAGENGSGKSTLSKLLYYVFKTACNYEDLVEDELRQKLHNIVRFIEIAIFESSNLRNDMMNRRELMRVATDLYNDGELLTENKASRWKVLIESISTSYFGLADDRMKGKRLKPHFPRMEHILSELLKGERGADVSHSTDSFQKVNDLLQSYYKEAFNKLKTRPVSLFNETFESAFLGSKLPVRLDVLEYDEQIVSTKKSNLSIPYSIQNVIYTDTPMSVGATSDVEHWNDLDELLQKKGKSKYADMSQRISNEIIGGEVILQDDNLDGSSFQYKRADGSVFNLLDCATGIRSFAILQLLLKNGSLNDKTLLIIDEPEVHLHPQWVVEYARLLVMLNKEVGVKFFVASHDPDFVSAIRYISEKQGVLKNVNYYLAEKGSENYKYNYRHLGVDIDPVFKSFNIAIDKIDKYSV